MPVALDESWYKHLKELFDQPFMTDLKSFLAAEMAAGKRIFPKPSQFLQPWMQHPYQT